MNQNYTATVILLAGGAGLRLGSSTPKQYLNLGRKAIFQYSLDCFLMIPEVIEVIVVCAPQFRALFDDSMPDIDLHFADAGKRRQDSMSNGFAARKHNSDIICIHDAARPFLTATLTKSVMDEALIHGAATAAIPLKFTVKEGDDEGFVVGTPPRSMMWEVQTPQAVTPQLLQEGLEKAEELDVTVTDDVSLVELLNNPVKLVTGSDSNIKITTTYDLYHAEALLSAFDTVPETHRSMST